MITKDEISLDYVDVMFEITRFCNMTCPHCIRGDSQRMRIKKDYINATLGQLSNIGSMMFTGGEPALALDLMDYTYDACLHYNIDVQNFWMATNGTITSKKFFDMIETWVNFCTDNEISGLRVSLDNYHDEIDNCYAFEEFIEYSGLQLNLELHGAPNDSENLLVMVERLIIIIPLVKLSIICTFNQMVELKVVYTSTPRVLSCQPAIYPMRHLMLKIQNLSFAIAQMIYRKN